MEPKPETSHTYVNIGTGRERVDFDSHKNEVCKADVNLHATTIDNSESEGEKPEAESDNGQLVRPVDEVPSQIQYKGAKSVYEVYIF